MERKELLRKLKIFLTFLLLLCFPAMGCTAKSKPLDPVPVLPTSQGTTEVRTAQPYVLDVGDSVAIKVIGFDEFTKTAIVDTSGEIFLPHVGQVKIAGQTVPQARELLASRLQKYLINPQIELSTDLARQRVYVFGEVNNPGAQTYRRPITVVEALAQANWLLSGADKTKVLLVRQAENRYHVHRVNTNLVFEDGGPAPQMFLQPGDLVYVPPAKITNVSRFMQKVQTILQPFMTAQQMVVLWPAFKSALEGTGSGISISTPSGGSPQ